MILWPPCVHASEAHCQGLFDAPSTMEPQLNRAGADAEPLSPFGERVRLAVVRKLPVRALIVRLVDVCCPSHVARLVAAIVVDAIKRVFSCGPWTHVAEEGSERGAPSLTYTDAAAAVVGVLLVALGVTARLHAAPNIVFGRVAGSVRCSAMNGAFPHQASTGLALSLVQGIEAHRSFRTTLATTECTRTAVLDALSPWAGDYAKNGPTSVFHGLNYTPGYVLNVQTGMLEPKPNGATEKK